jgi:hypothetical protein
MDCFRLSCNYLLSLLIIFLISLTKYLELLSGFYETDLSFVFKSRLYILSDSKELFRYLLWFRFKIGPSINLLCETLCSWKTSLILKINSSGKYVSWIIWTILTLLNFASIFSSWKKKFLLKNENHLFYHWTLYWN